LKKHHSGTAPYYAALVLLSLLSTFANGAEDEVILLTIESELIGLIEPMQVNDMSRHQARQLIVNYHELLNSKTRAEIEYLHEKILTLIPELEIAYSAADSAEEVTQLLNEAYQLILPSLGEP
jgi:hypothetical protein